MTGPADCRRFGRRRIVESDLRDRNHLDPARPASIAIEANGRGEITFAAMQATLDIRILNAGRVTSSTAC